MSNAKSITPWGRMCKSQMALRGMTLKELGNVTGYSATYLSSIINGRLIVPDETIQKINTALNIT